MRLSSLHTDIYASRSHCGPCTVLGAEVLGIRITSSRTELFLTMVKSRMTRLVLGAGIAAEADAEAILTVGIQSIRRGAENVESIKEGFR